MREKRGGKDLGLSLYTSTYRLPAACWLRTRSHLTTNTSFFHRSQPMTRIPVFLSCRSANQINSHQSRTLSLERIPPRYIRPASDDPRSSVGISGGATCDLVNNLCGRRRYGQGLNSWRYMALHCPPPPPYPLAPYHSDPSGSVT